MGDRYFYLNGRGRLSEVCLGLRESRLNKESQVNKLRMSTRASEQRYSLVLEMYQNPQAMKTLLIQELCIYLIYILRRKVEVEVLYTKQLNSVCQPDFIGKRQAMVGEQRQQDQNQIPVTQGKLKPPVESMDASTLTTLGHERRPPNLSMLSLAFLRC
jgi:hypothetical protein